MSKWEKDIWVWWLKPYGLPNLIKDKAKTVVIASGYFAPLHSGHLSYLNEAKKLGDELWVIVNNNIQLKNKKGYIVQDRKERLEIIRSLKFVDHAQLSCSEGPDIHYDLLGIFINSELNLHQKNTKFIVCNGGDQKTPNELEKKACDQFNVEMRFGVGGEKSGSSSEIIERIGNHYLEKTFGVGWQNVKPAVYKGDK